MSPKRVCEHCGWCGYESQILKAPNPFDREDEITGCPRCKQIETIRVACEVGDCFDFATCGTPVDGVYFQTCGRHMPKVDGDR